MARTAASVEDLMRGTLPPICAKTGRVADGWVTMRFAETPGWTWILLLFGILPFLIARAFSTVRISGHVPMSDAALVRGRRFTWTCWGLLALGVVLLGLGVANDVSGLALAGLGVLVGALVLNVVASPFIWPTGRLVGDWVVLSFVDGRFADALDRRYGRHP